MEYSSDSELSDSDREVSFKYNKISLKTLIIWTLIVIIFSFKKLLRKAS